MKIFTRATTENSESYLKFFNLNRIQDKVKEQTAHLPASTLITYDPSELKQVMSKVHDLAAILGYPLIIRSSTEFEDHTDYQTSGLFDSRVVYQEGELVDSVEAVHYSLLETNTFGGLGLIIQEYIEISIGAVISMIKRKDRSIIIAELSSKSVPVDEEPDYRYSWILEDDQYRSLDYNKLDLEAYENALQMLSVVTQLKTSTEYSLEFELGVSSNNQIYLFQIRELLSLDYPRVHQFQNFGADRNYPPPVDLLTGSLMERVLTDSFYAQVVYSDAGEFVTNSKLPSSMFIYHVQKVYEMEGPISLELMQKYEESHRAWWHTLLQWCIEVEESDEYDAQRLITLVQFAQQQLAKYFSNPLFLLSIAAPSPPNDPKIIKLISPYMRSYRVNQIFESFNRGDDDALDKLNPYLLDCDDLLSNPPLYEQLKINIGLKELYDKIEYESIFLQLQQDINQVALNTEDFEWFISLWYQEVDNQFKNLIFSGVRSFFMRLCDHLKVDRSLFTNYSIMDYLSMIADISHKYILENKRSYLYSIIKNKPKGKNEYTQKLLNKFQLIYGSIEGEIEVIVKRDRHRDFMNTDLDHVGQVQGLWLNNMTSKHVYYVPQCEVLLVEGLGFLSHASHIIRSKNLWSIVVSMPLEKSIEHSTILHLTLRQNGDYQWKILHQG